MTVCDDCGHGSPEANNYPRLCDQPSPFQHLLVSNPDAAAVQGSQDSIRNYLADIRQDLYRSQARVERLRRALAAAEKDQTGILDLINKHSSLNHPIHNIPSEILAHIFSFTFRKPFHVFETRGEGPWLLGKVCRRWRKVAWETPELWNCFEVIGGPGTHYGAPAEPPADEHREEILLGVLERSGNTKLQVWFEAYHRPKKLLEILASHSSHLADLKLSGLLENLRAFKDAEPMDMLKSLELLVDVRGFPNEDTDDEDTPETSHQYDNEPYFDILDKAPQLSHLKLTLGGDLPSPVSLMLPWSQLTYFDLEFSGDNPGNILPFLAACTNLEWFRDQTAVGEEDYSSMDRALEEKIVLPRLTYLSLRCPFISMPFLTCPALEIFEVGGSLDEFPRADLKRWQKFAERSRFMLKELDLVPEDVFSHITIPFLNFVDDLKYVPKLVVDLHDVDPPYEVILGALRLKPDAKVAAFPALRSLSIRLSARSLVGRKFQSHMQETTEQQLIEMIESRWVGLPEGHPARLEELEVACDTRVPLGEEMELDEFNYEDRDVIEMHERFKGMKLYRTLEMVKEQGLKTSLVTGYDHVQRL